MVVVKEEKVLYLMVDHSNCLKGLREDVLVPIPSKYLGANGSASEKEGAEDVVLQDVDNGNASEIEDGDGSDSFNSEFYDSAWDAEDGNDNLFQDNVDKEVNEDDAGLEH
jgi:hypothetical protein